MRPFPRKKPFAYPNAQELGRAENTDTSLLNLARKTLDFQANGIYRFQKGTPQAKRLILQIIGSNLFLKDRKLLLDFKKPFLAIAEAQNPPNGQKQPFEPMETIANTGQNAENPTVCPAPSGRLDSNQRPLGPEPSALTKLSYAPKLILPGMTKNYISEKSAMEL